MKLAKNILMSLGTHACAAILAHGEVKQLQVPTSLRVIVGLVDGKYGQRLTAVHALGKDLCREEVVTLCAFLKLPPRLDEPNLRGLHALKNDILNTLRRQNLPPEGLTELLIGIYHDSAQDGVTRDYAIQHLVSWYGRAENEGVKSQEKIRSVLFEAARNHGSIAGTALLGLHRLSAEDTAFNQGEIDTRALNLAISPGSESATRMTAIQVCAERGLKKAVPAIRSLAQSSPNRPLQISAIAAMGQLGEAADIPLLQQVQAEPDETLQLATQNALRQLRQRQKLY